MKVSPSNRERGVALMVVMIAIFVLSVLAGAFAYSMKVETKLALNADNETQLIWLGRSGVERARWILSFMSCPYDSLNQKWAGGPGADCELNGPLADVDLDNFQVGDGLVSLKITDLERKFNINVADEAVLQQAFTLVGIDASEIPAISAAILDWIDPDDATRVNGAESDYYQTLTPPYMAKNRPLDDLSELLLVRGITTDMYWGSASTNHAPAAFQRVDRWGRPVEEPNYPVGIVDLFTALSSGRVNVNTASATVLQAIPGVDENAAAQIVKQRSGPDGVDGTEDDTPFQNVGELINAGVSREAMQSLPRYADTRSRTFAVDIDARIRGSRRIFHAVLGRNNPRDIQVLSFYWE